MVSQVVVGDIDAIMEDAGDVWKRSDSWMFGETGFQPAKAVIMQATIGLAHSRKGIHQHTPVDVDVEGHKRDTEIITLQISASFNPAGWDCEETWGNVDCICKRDIADIEVIMAALYLK
jgi:hypothetical protein